MEGKASILVVDDNISLCKTMSFALRRKGYAVTAADGGPEAIEEVKKRSFDIIFMDIKMPHMNGVETYKRIKKIRPEAVVVMMTAYAVEDLVQEALKEGACGIIYKPLDIEEVAELIEWSREDKESMVALVVDDDLENCSILKDILIKRGFKVDIAHTGEEAIIMAQEKIYGLIFIDMKLPDLNGLETYLAFKKTNQDAAAIMMTTPRQEMVGLVEEALNNNAYAYLYKPIDMEELFRLIEEIREGKQRVG